MFLICFVQYPRKASFLCFTLCLGEVRSGVLNEKTHLPTTLTDLCDGGKIDSYCVTCEVRPY